MDSILKPSHMLFTYSHAFDSCTCSYFFFLRALFGFLNNVAINICISDDSVARSKSMPLANSQSSQSSGRHFTRSITEKERKGKNNDDASIRIVGEPRLSNRRKVSPSLLHLSSYCNSFLIL